MILFTIASQSIIKIHLNINGENSNNQDLIDQFPNTALIVNKTPFVVGIYGGPNILDPVDTWDYTSRDVQYQVVEGLVGYNYSSHPNYEIIPKLAENWRWHSPTRISFKIRENVYFHDGTLLDANIVKWNFERLMYFCNVTGTLPANSTSWEAFPSSLFFFSNGTYIFKDFEVLSTYNFTINLNAPFAALLDLLCFGAIVILSPNSTPKFGYLNLYSDKLVGTGPFVYDDYNLVDEVRFHAYHNYWGGKAEIEEMIWLIEFDGITRMNAALNGTYDYVTGIMENYIDIFKADPDIHVEDVGEGIQYTYLEIYSGAHDTDGTPLGGPQFQKNNASFRRALAYSINYTYIWEEIIGSAVEGFPAVPRGMPGYNSSVVQASDSKYNFTWGIYKARQIMASMYPAETAGLDLHLGTDDALWQSLSLRTVEINMHEGWITNGNLNQLLDINFGLIGVQTIETIRTWSNYVDTGKNSPWEMDISLMSWGPDYFNPFGMIDPLFNIESANTFSRINDTSLGGLTDMLNVAVAETNKTKQLEIYQDIQSYIYDVERPLTPASHTHISGWTSSSIQSVHSADLVGINYNLFSILDFYQVKWNKLAPAPGPFNLTSNAGSPDYDGNFMLSWNSSERAHNYSIYIDDSFISIIDGTQTLLGNQATISPFPVIGLSNGDYYFVVVAHNKLGDKLSNNLRVNVSLMVPGSFVLTSDADTPDGDGSFNLYWNSSIGADNYSIYWQNSSIIVIDGSPTLLLDHVTTSLFPVSGLASGDYYFVVVAHNTQGDTLSNNIYVNVSLMPPGSFVLTSDADTPDSDGSFNLIWTSSTGADNYSIYRHNSSISILDGSQTLLLDHVAISPFSASGLANGEYYFIVVAHNTQGDTLSNNLYVNVQVILPASFVLTSDADTPDNDGIFNLFWTISTGADNYSIYRHDSSISIIDGSQTLLVYQITIFLYPVSGLASGEYYFIVVAHNGSVDTLSNNVFVIVQLSEDIPGYNIGLIIAIASLTSIYFIKKRRK